MKFLKHQSGLSVAGDIVLTTILVHRQAIESVMLKVWLFSKRTNLLVNAEVEREEMDGMGALE